MQYVLDELQKSLRYHLRQLEENLNKIRLYEETIEDLKTRNGKHKDAISEIGKHIESLETDLQDGHLNKSTEKQNLVPLYKEE